MVDPVSKSSVQECEKCRMLLRAFWRIDFNSCTLQTVDKKVQPLKRGIPVDPYHRWLFSGCTKPEKLLLVQLAQEKLINPNSRCVVKDLVRAGLIVKRRGLLTVKNDHFADY